MRIMRLTLSMVMIAAISPNLSSGRSLGQSGVKPVKIEKEWRGEIKLELLQLAPKNRFIANGKAWAKLWRAYRGNEEPPKIDFDKQMILVGFGRNDPTIISPYLGLMPDGEGDLKVIFVEHLVLPRNPETCRYIFLLISREGVKSINGTPIRND